MDNYRTLRELPLLAVLAHLGFADFRKTRDGHAGPCPVHGSKTNRGCFRFTDAGVYHCLSCHAKGKGALDLVLALRKISLSEAVRVLEGIQGLPMAESPRGEPQVAARSFLEPLKAGSYSKFFKKPCPWLEARGISQETADAYGAGWYSNPARKSAYSERFMVPFRRFEDGAVMGYMGRDISEAPAVKYLVPTGFPKSNFLFGAVELKQKAPVKVRFVVESPFCVMKFRQLGFDAVALYPPAGGTKAQAHRSSCSRRREPNAGAGEGVPADGQSFAR
jgi:DNA primase